MKKNLPFVPRAPEIDQKQDKRLASVAKIIDENLLIHDAALAVLHHEPWNFAAVYFDGIDHFCHGFMRYHPPRLEWVPEKDYELYRGVVEAGYIMHDVMLGNLLKEAGEDVTVILVSDHGFHSDHLRPQNVPQEPAGPAVQHRHYGIFVMAGPGIRKDDRVYGASLLDVCPTILALYGLPVGQDMDGKVLLEAFEDPLPPLHAVASWDRESGPSGMHPQDRRLDPVEASQAINQLVALGYIEAPDENREKAVKQTVRELDYNLARTYMDADLHIEAVPILERLWKDWEDEWRFGIHLVRSYQAQGRTEEARRVMEDVLTRKQEVADSSRKKLQEWAKENKEKAPKDLPPGKATDLQRLRAKAFWNPYAVEYLMGSLLLDEGDARGALERFLRAEQLNDSTPALHLKLGNTYLKLGNGEAAERSFQKALDLDPDNADACLGLSRGYLRRGRPRDAAEAADAAIRLLFYNPTAFFLLGVALLRMDDVDRAVDALNGALVQNPNFPVAHRWLAYIYKKRLYNPLKAAEHLDLAREAVRRGKDLKEGRLREARRVREEVLAEQVSGETEAKPVEEAVPLDIGKTVVVVSGLPRSGTSMMMQMLSRGGLPVLSDNKRVADEDNPRGYFEYEKSKNLGTDASWIPEARGRVVKIVAQLLDQLPSGHDYRIIFMERDLNEVIVSQKRMLERQGKKGAQMEDSDLARVFSEQISRVLVRLSMRRLPVLRITFSDAICQPEETAARVNAFLGGILEEKSMAAAIEPDLHRVLSLPDGVSGSPG